MANFNVIDIEPTRTYATRENAIKAVEKKFAGIVDGPRMFNVLVMPYPSAGRDRFGDPVTRYFPVLINIDKNALQQLLHCGFNLIN